MEIKTFARTIKEIEFGDNSQIKAIKGSFKVSELRGK